MKVKTTVKEIFFRNVVFNPEKPRRRVIQSQNITRQNEQRSKEHNELTIITYRNTRKILKRQRISTFFAAICLKMFHP